MKLKTRQVLFPTAHSYRRAEEFTILVQVFGKEAEGHRFKCVGVGLAHMFHI